MKYEINLKNEDYFTVEIDEDDLPPTLITDNTTGFSQVQNLPAGWSVDPSQVLYINPVEDDE